MLRRCFLMGFLVGGLFLGLGASELTAQSVLEPESAGSVDAVEARLWIREARDLVEAPVYIEIDFPEELSAGDVATFECRVHSDSEMGTGTLRLQVLDAAGTVLDEGAVMLQIASGTTSCQFNWPAPSLGDGEYVVKFDLIEIGSIIRASRELIVTKISKPAMEAGLAGARTALRGVQEHLKALGDRAPDSPYLRLRLALAEDFLAQLPEDSDDWPRVSEISRYATRALGAIRSRMTFGGRDGAWAMPSLSGLEVRNGAFYAEGRPVFLFGLRQPAMRPEDFERLSRYQFNYAALNIFLSDAAIPKADLPTKLDALFERAKENNVSITLLLDLEKGRKNVSDGADDGVAPLLSVGEAEQFMKFGIDLVAPYLGGREMLNGLGVIPARELSVEGEETRIEFIKWVRERYSDRLALNRAWRTRHASFDDVTVDQSFDRSSYQYDWHSYWRNQTTQLYTRLADYAAERIPGVAVQFIYGGGAFAAGESHRGLAHEALAELFPLTGIDAITVRKDSPYAYDFAAASAVHTLRRSFAPGKPIFSFAYQGAPEGHGSLQWKADTVRSQLWESAIDGVSGFAVDAGNGTAGETLFDHPAVLEAFAMTALDLNRLAPIVVAFQQAAATVGILWSDSSKIYHDGDPFLASALRAFEGCSFAGAKIRFVTESQCASGGFEGLEFLVIPNMPALSDPAFSALQAHVETGGALIRAATPIPYDAWGHSRDDVILYGPGTLLVRGRDSSTEYLHAMDAALYRNHESYPRTVNAHDYPLEGVKSRYAELDGETYLYLINLREEAALCHLTAGYSRGRDLVSGGPVRFPLLLEPLHPMLLRLETPETREDLPLQALQPEEAPDIPTAVVRPVPADDGSAS